ncbi:cysteine hydrolase family protein [Bradyrhizobium sp. 6(2017)]|uniref:cysteine hydrolase family protein n=1 Tax=Bradyrhizobium sp. 6(2017) TaxID=1197460 RepID=UPI0013E18F6D|nr:cysteine hydrolase family protein [Bradyrhizobium sp. 6(2017)]QIG95542.1 cysteine hydrolase [Bradyrhizobium sp. 6(2017)]
MSHRAIIVVDIQNEYFPCGKLPLVGIELAAANAAKVIQDARARADTVIHFRHEMQDPQAPIFTPSTEGVEISPIVQPLDGEAVILKHHPNAFRDTDLKQRLDAKGIKEVVIVGAMSHMCIDATSRAAVDHGYTTTIVHDACATRDLEFRGMAVPAVQVHAAFMAALGFAYGTVTTTSDYLKG